MKLNYNEQGGGHSVFLIHGLFGSLSNLGNLARVLESNYRVISVDLRNHVVGDYLHGDTRQGLRRQYEFMDRDVANGADHSPGRLLLPAFLSQAQRHLGL